MWAEHMTDERGTAEVWTYIGRRAFADGRIGHVYLDPSNREVAFSKVRAAVIGGRYEVRVERGDGISVIGAPSYVGSTEEDDHRRVKWAAHDYFSDYRAASIAENDKGW